MKLSDFDYHLPPELIAQHPAPERDRSRLMVLDRSAGTITHRTFCDLVEYLSPPDALVVNDTRVMPARLMGRRPSGGAVQGLVLAVMGEQCRLMLKPAGRVKPHEVLLFEDGAIRLRLLERDAEGHWLAASEAGPLAPALYRAGRAPLPPYIDRTDGLDPLREADRERYQTVFAEREGAIAAPTAGLHFTPQLLAEIEAKGVPVVRLTLHVGLGTFEPIRAERVEDHRMHAEWFEFPESAAAACAAARAQGGRITAVGTTSARTLETVWERHGAFRPDHGETALYIIPGFTFGAVDRLVTNFHLPRSSLLLLVCAFAGRTSAGRDLVLRAYETAVREKYRFYSYGDAMLIL